MHRRIRHYVILSLGWIFIFLGVLGLFLPILQGILFLCIGALLLSSKSPRMRLLILKLGQRYPKLREAMTAAKEKARAWRDRLLLRGVCLVIGWIGGGCRRPCTPSWRLPLKSPRLDVYRKLVAPADH